MSQWSLFQWKFSVNMNLHSTNLKSWLSMIHELLWETICHLAYSGKNTPDTLSKHNRLVVELLFLTEGNHMDLYRHLFPTQNYSLARTSSYIPLYQRKQRWIGLALPIIKVICFFLVFGYQWLIVLALSDGHKYDVEGRSPSSRKHCCCKTA